MINDQLHGAIYGHLIGDAFGVPYEFIPPHGLPEQIEWCGYGTHNQPPGTWSDDGALMLCAMASFCDKRTFDPQDIMTRFVAWYDEGYMAAGGVVFDIGNTTRQAIMRFKQGSPALAAGPSSENDNGNGSLMRILPFALWAGRRAVEGLIELCHDGSRLTHGHPRSQACCAVYGLLIRQLLSGSPRHDVWDLAVSAVDNVYARNQTDAFRDQLRMIRDFEDCRGSGYVVDCLCSSWRAVLDAEDYSDAVRRAVRFGNDTDTTAAVAGSLAGVVFGFESIPTAWRDELRLADDQREMIKRFVEISEK